MKLRHLGLALLVALLALSRAALAQSTDLKLVLFGKVTKVEGRTVTYMSRDGSSGTIEFSPKAVVHDTTQPYAATQSLADVKPDDIFVLAVDGAGKTHLAIVRNERATHREWDAIFVQIIPGYGSIYGGAAQSGQPAPSGQTTPPETTTGEKYKMIMVGKLTAMDGSKVSVQSSDGKTASVTMPPNAVYHDASQAFGVTSSASALQVGDEVLLTVDGSDVAHVLFLHPGAKLHSSWPAHMSH